ncbi:MAG: ShlB/FhaC/HecB family hemolysin secretion/activation protein [Alphaproteobacteria bacterium]|nr:ShlB/FhaC/HecB family hemolysin secretion/activation protein [Alphaproteobacteria bacterium]
MKKHALFNKALARLSCSMMVITSLAMPVMAQAQIAQQSRIADPGRVQEELRPSLTIPQQTPDIGIKSMQLLGAPAGAENIRFNFGGVEVTGAKIYTSEQLATVYQGQIGQEISLADLYQIANNITLKYRNDGYVLTQVVVPPQTIEGGIARLQVVEGFINNVTVESPAGEPESAMKLVREYASQIVKGEAANVKDLERNLLLINDLPGLSARSVISPSPDVPGGADIAIIVERDPFEGLVSIDNYGSRYLGPVQLGAQGTLNSPFGLNDFLTGQLVVAPGKGYELGYVGAEYGLPVGSYGTILSALVSYTDTEPGHDLRRFSVDGKSKYFSLKAEHPFIRSRENNLSGRLLFDVRNAESESLLSTTKDQIRAVRTGMKFDFLDRMLGAAVNTGDIEISKGVGILGASDERDANLSRALGDPQFTKATADLQRLQRVTDSVNILLGARGQVSSGPLLSSEEFSVGGINSGRGYDPSEIVGDEGVSGKVELQWNNPLDSNFVAMKNYQVFSFYDVGKVWNDDATTSSDKKLSLASAGAGVRMNFEHDVDASFGFAVPLTRGVQTKGGDTDTQFYFNLNKKF